MEKKSRDTVGKICNDLLKKPDRKQGVMDTQIEMAKKYIPGIQECIDKNKALVDPYYIVVISKRERLLINAIRQYFVARKTLPTPDYDQTVFKYTPVTGDLKYLWTVPDKNSIEEVIANYKKYDPSLVKYCLLFKENKLDIVYGE
jgi:hypothetical protein